MSLIKPQDPGFLPDIVEDHEGENEIFAPLNRADISALSHSLSDSGLDK